MTTGLRHKQRGSAMLETALIFLTALGMILFIVDMGRIQLWQQFLAERARVGVRNAVVNHWDAEEVANYVVYNSTTAPESAGPGLLGLLPSQVAFTQDPGTGNGDARYEVKIANVPVVTWIPFIAGRYILPPVTASMPVQSQGAVE